MIITRTPMRVSLFGGGSDRREWYSEHGGEVLGFAIDKYCYISLRKLPPFFDYKHRIVWSKIELAKTHDEISHPAAREILRMYLPDIGVELHHDGDLPARSGLGSSSSFVVGLLSAAFALRREFLPTHALAYTAINMEREVLREQVGSQDQVWAAYGGFNRIEFRPGDAFDVRPVIMKQDRQEAFFGNLMLFFTGISRMGEEIARKQVAGLPQKRRQMQAIRSLVGEAAAVLHSPAAPLDDLGALLHEGWRLKKDLAEGVSTGPIDQIYEAARSAGALGGKLLGAGAGGFMLFYVPAHAQKAVRERLSKLVEVPFHVAVEGSRVLVYEPNGW